MLIDTDDKDRWNAINASLLIDREDFYLALGSYQDGIWVAKMDASDKYTRSVNPPVNIA
ncbi:hypothetical protein K469DRAFT_709552 [Zopfia rhizophila CBS 207.26]|uniref:Uncharacterized protein n=1 Tax=Zopfia rhizophila CBS 207.26 TaxID=1314779 RepID=A0A6A6ETI6_9PEZI|nr:hypothetical protein K469DRAFT_709552 [Zopfia rhizophila CBS 207.26]